MIYLSLLMDIYDTVAVFYIVKRGLLDNSALCKTPNNKMCMWGY